jgi:hypothetical protein
MSQVTDDGNAVTVTDTPGSDAVADCGCHAAPTHNQVGRLTS